MNQRCSPSGRGCPFTGTVPQSLWRQERKYKWKVLQGGFLETAYYGWVFFSGFLLSNLWSPPGRRAGAKAGLQLTTEPCWLQTCVLGRCRNSFYPMELNAFKTFSLKGYLSTSPGVPLKREETRAPRSGGSEGEVSRLLLTMWTIGIVLLAAANSVSYPGVSSHCRRGTEQPVGELAMCPNVIWLLLWVIYI